MAEIAIQIQNVTKTYPIPREKRLRTAVDRLTLSVEAGTLFGFLGPNGAGKTTTIKMLLGFIAPTSGGAWLFDRPISDDQARRRVGYLPEQPYFPKFLTAQEVVRVHAGLSGLTGSKARERVDACLRQVEMSDHHTLPLSKCSKGMVQRVGLASALVGDPDLLIMDEPSSGLDPVGRKDLRRLLVSLKNEGKTIFLSSHLLQEMEPVCDRIGVLAHGSLVACGAPSEITQSRDEVLVQISQQIQDTGLVSEVIQMGGTTETLADQQQANFRIPSGMVYRLLHLLDQRHAKLISVLPQRETLEDAFLRLVK